MKNSKSVRKLADQRLAKGYQAVGIKSISTTYADFIKTFMVENEMISCCIAGLDEVHSLYVVKALAYFSAELLKDPTLFPGLFECLSAGNHCLSEEGVLATAERFTIRFDDFFNDDQFSRLLNHVNNKMYEY